MPPHAEIPFFIIAGPTAVGKSELAVEVAERCGGEIVSADAFQIYAGLPVLTAQPSAAQRERAPHHLIGEIPVSQGFDLAQFTTLARHRIGEIHARGRVPIVSGGAGLYLRALTRGLADLPAADPALRAELESRPAAELQRQYALLDPAGASRLDLQNPRRLIRALEVCLLTGRPFSNFRKEWERPSAVSGVLLLRERDELHARIDRRTRAMFEDGVEAEVARLTEIGPTAAQTLGLREILALLRGEVKRDACIAAIQQATRRYAKRQLTWFRRETALEQVDLTALSDRTARLDSIASQATAAAGPAR